MTLELAPEPVRPLEIARAKVAELARRDRFLTPALRRIAGEEIELAKWHRTLYLGLNALADRKLALEDAPELGWRFFLEHEHEVVAAVESRLVDDEYRPGPLTEGPLVSGTARAFDEAEALANDRNVRYTPVLLVSPGLHVTALWLQSVDNSGDEIVPVPPINRPLKPFEPMKPERFLSCLQDIAVQVRQKLAEGPSYTRRDKST